MSTSAREYVSMTGLGDLNKCREMMEEYGKSVRKLNSESKRASCYARVFTSEADILDECRDVQEIQQHTRGVFPVLWVNLTYDPSLLREEEILALEAQCNLSLLGVVHADWPFRTFGAARSGSAGGGTSGKT
jgi:hypothetical protein